MNLKKIVADYMNLPESKIMVSPRMQAGDFCYPCFERAKQVNKAPPLYANDLKEELEKTLNKDIEKIEVVGGYLNFFLKKSQIAKEIIAEKLKNPISVPPQNKVVAIDYCSPNLAKYLHIGHLSTTFIGESLQRINTLLGNKVVRINYVGDFGTPFGKMVVAIQKWGNEEDIEKLGIDYVQGLYVKFSSNETEELMDMARFASKRIEDKTGNEYEIYKKIIAVSVGELKRIISLMGIDFDDWRGESFYNDKMTNVIAELKSSGIAKQGENNALIVDLDKLGIAVVQRGDGGTVYLTRDLTAMQDRYNLYHFDEMFYVVAVQQKQYFEQLFKISELLGRPYAQNLKHISFGMFSTPEGKIASRKGKQALFVDMFKTAYDKALDIIKDKTFEIEKKEEVAKKVALSAIAFSILKVERNKDKIFDLASAISFDGETAPYIQYTYARCCSLIRKYKNFSFSNDGNLELLDNIYENNFELLKTLNNFENTILNAQNIAEPYILAKDILLIAKLFNKLYNEVKILDVENKMLSTALIEVVNLTKNILEIAMPLVMINPIVEM